MAASRNNVSVNKNKSSDLLALERTDNANHLESVLDLKKKPDKREMKTFKLPPSSILSQVKSFLPQMKMANQELQNRPAEEIDIEHVSEDQDRVIEMNIAVVEQSSDFSKDNDSEHSSDSDSDNSDADECLMGKVTENNLRINKRTKHKPDIVELSNKLEHSSKVEICDLNGDNG